MPLNMPISTTRRKVTAVNEANIMKLADGLFLESCHEIAKKYPSIQYNEMIVDNCSMQLVSKPEQFDVMVTPNLHKNLVANIAAGIAGGTGFMPGEILNVLIPFDHAIFEQGASAGNVGNEKVVETNKANPVALLLSSAIMLRHLQFPSFARQITDICEACDICQYHSRSSGCCHCKYRPTFNIFSHFIILTI